MNEDAPRALAVGVAARFGATPCFLKTVSPNAVTRIVKQLNLAAKGLPDCPRKGLAVDGFSGRDVRAIIVGDYELRYEVTADELIILRIWHSREDR